MDSEDAVHQAFVRGDIAYLDAIERLQGLGYKPKDAESCVGEWADRLSDAQPSPTTQTSGSHER